MPVSVDQYWKLLVDSGLHAPAECERLRGLAAAAGAEADAHALSAWLIAQGTLTPYQAAVLLGGRPGPFVFGPLVVTDRIPSGRLARLFRARYEDTQVLLVLLNQFTQDASEYGALAESARLAATVKHPHVSRTYRATRQNGQAFIITESLSGQSLAERSGGAPQSVAKACNQVLDVAKGLVALHAAGLVHGGVSPQNVLLGEDGSAKLLQFPLVSPAERADRFELPLVSYLAPEWSEPDAAPTAAVDVYALGCLLFELITGHPPFAGGNPRQTVERHRREIPQRLDELVPAVSPYLADLVDEMLAKDPALRCASAARVVEILAPLAAAAERMPTSDSSLARAQVAVERPVAGAISVAVGETPVAYQLGNESLQPDRDDPRAAVAPARATATKSTGRRSNRSLVLLAAGGAGLALAAAALLLVARSQVPVAEPPAAPAASLADASVGNQAVAPPVAEAENASTEETSSPTSAAANGEVLLVNDDGRTLWDSPTAGQPLSLDYLPSGAQTIVVLRPAALLGSADGAKLLAALGPGEETLLEKWRQTLGVELATIEELAIAFVPDETLQPRAAYRMRLAEPLAREPLLAAWGDPAPAEHAGQTYFERNGLAYYFAEAEGGNEIAICPAAMMPQMLELEGHPLLRTSIEKLLETSDAERWLSIFLVPNFLLTDGQPLLVGGLGHLKPALRELVDERIDAVALSVFLDTDLYLEFRAIAPVERRPNELLAQVQARWQSAPQRVEHHLASAGPQPHAADLLQQFPEMLRTAHSYTRGGIDQRQAVLSMYLPADAAHNLLMGGELALWASGELGPAAGATEEPPPMRPAAELLAQRVSLSFPRDTLDGALGVLSREIGLPIVIQGNDLQSDGITRNQSLSDFNERNQPAAAVLRKLLLLANPAGKLVYQVKRDAAGHESVLVTTRTAVGRRGEQPADGF